MKMHTGSSPTISTVTSATSSRIIYKTEIFNWFVWILILSRFIRCAGLYFAFDVIQKTHVINFVWVLSSICCLLFGVVQRPFGKKRKNLQLTTWLKIAQYSLVQNVLLTLLFYGLSQVGPYRASLLAEHSDVIILTVCAAVFKGKGGPRKLRGAICFVLAVFSLILFDNDSAAASVHPEGHLEGYTHHGVKHIVFYIVSWMGLSDHEGGLLILIVTSVLMISLRNHGTLLAPEVGGAKLLNALVWFMSFCLLTPCVMLLWLIQASSFVDALSSIHLCFCISLMYFVFHYYVNSACSQRLTPNKTAQIGTVSILLSSLFLSIMWPQTAQVFHRVSGGAVFSLFLFLIATTQLTTLSHEMFGLPSGELLPLHLSADALSKSYSFFAFFRSTLQAVLIAKNSRFIFYFLCVNLAFTFVELIYGMWTNSLGLISDGFHMLFDCSALVMGLTASVMAQWKQSKRFPYGYGRIEVLSGFVNALFLSVIGIVVLIEALERLFEPPPVHTERLLAVAICGLIVNLCGILAFRSNGHGHSHGGSHNHSHMQGKESFHAHSHNANMEGVFLHILADTLGSVAVIVSSVLIDWYGWLIADPICSLVLAVLILGSVLPLLRNSATVLLLGVPSGIKRSVDQVVEKILEVDSVLSCTDPHFWEHCDNVSVATVNVFISGDIPEQKIIHKITSILLSYGFSQVSVQVEVKKNSLDLHLSPPNSFGIGSVKKDFYSNQNMSQLYIKEI